MKGKLFLIPTLLAEETQQDVIPLHVREAVKVTSYFLCENIRFARRYIGSLKIHDSIELLQFEVLDKDTKPEMLSTLLAPLLEGNNMGVISESGCPGIADPGSMAVHFAHKMKIKVVPLVGPSSILLALMASGMNGQKFAFHGYLPIDATNAMQTIKHLEKESKEKSQTQIFIETPYRNNALLGHLLKALHSDTQLCIAQQLTSPQEKIICQEVNQWKKHPVTFEKEPAVFLFLAAT